MRFGRAVECPVVVSVAVFEHRYFGVCTIVVPNILLKMYEYPGGVYETVKYTICR